MSLDEPASSKSAPVEITEGRSVSVRQPEGPVFKFFILTMTSSSLFFQMKQPCMIAKFGCGVSKPSRGRFLLLVPSHPTYPQPSGRLREKMGGDGDVVVVVDWYMTG